jgi:putative DNA methylase
MTVKLGEVPSDLKNGTKLARGANFRCLLSNSPIEPDCIKAEGTGKRLGTRLMAAIAEGARGRVYLSPTREIETAALAAREPWKPEGELVKDARAFTPYLYGLLTWSELFTTRQLVALSTFSSLVGEVREKARADSLSAGMQDGLSRKCEVECKIHICVKGTERLLCNGRQG